MRWLWYVGPIVVALVFLWSALWPTRRQRVRAAELRRWVDELLGPMPGRGADGGRAPQRLLRLLPREFAEHADAAGLGRTVGNVVLVPKHAYLAVRDANAVAGSDHQCVVFKLAKPAPRMVIRPLPMAEGRRQENRGLDIGDPEFFELFEIDGDDAKAIKRWLAPSIRRALCELPTAWLRVEDKMATLSTYGFADGDGLDALVDAADAIFAKRGAGKAPSLFGDADTARPRAAERHPTPPPPTVATVGARAAAFGIDLLLFAAAIALLIGAVALREEGLEGLPGFPVAPKDEFDGPWQAGWNTKGVGALVAAEAVLVGLFVLQSYFAARRGQTIGMRLFGVKAVRLDGRPVDFFRGLLLRGWLIGAVPIAVAAALTRPFQFGAFLGNLVDPKVLAALAAAIALDVVVMFVGQGRRALHDYVAGTKVISTPPDLFAALRRP